MSADQKLQVQKDELYKLLLYCKTSIPYYQELFDKHAFDIEKVRNDIRAIEDLPIVTKEIIRENGSRMVSSAAIHPRKTGGSTGQTVYFHNDNSGLDWTTAINLRGYDMAGNFLHKRDCHISSELGIAPPPLKWRFLDWLKLFSQNRSRLMISSFSDADLEKTFKDLCSKRPFLLQGHPSSAYAIANYIKKKNIKKRK